MEDTGSQGFVERLLEVITSPFALWTYSWIGIVLVLLVAILIAVLQLRVIRKFNDADVLRSFPGKIPETEKGIEKRIGDLQRHARNRVSVITRRSLLMLIFGVIVPGSMLIFVAWYQSWFVSGSPVFLVSGAPLYAHEVEPFQLSAFVVDQALRGGLSDFFEVFGLGITPVSNNPDNVIFSGLVFAFRFLCGLVAVGIAWLLIRVGLGMRNLRLAIAKLEGDRDEASAAHS